MLRNSGVVGSLEGTEHGFDLGRLHVASPMDGEVFSREIGAQQVVSITQMGGLEFGFIDVESKRSPGHGLSGVGHLDADKTKRTARLCFRGADTHGSWSREGKLSRMARSLRNKRTRRFRRMAVSLAWRPVLLAST